MKKKLLVLLLSFVMVVTMMPLSVFANTANSQKGGNETIPASDLKVGDTIKVPVTDATVVDEGYLDNQGYADFQILDTKASTSTDGEEVDGLFAISSKIAKSNTSFGEFNNYAGSNAENWCNNMFYNALDAGVRQQLMSTTKEETSTYIKYNASSVRTIKATSIENANVFLPSLIECFGRANSSGTVTEPSKYFGNDDARIAYDASGTAVNYYTRSADANSNLTVGTVRAGGTYQALNSTVTTGHMRPAFNMSMEAKFEKTDTEGVYKWVPGGTTQYTVSFEMNGHGTQVPDQKVNEGETATEPKTPTEEGFTFEGWYSDAALTSQFNFATPITGDTILYAKWTDEKVTVSFNSIVEEGAAGGFYNGYGRPINSLNVPIGTEYTWTTDPAQNYIIEFGTGDIVFVTPGENTSITAHEFPDNPIETECEFTATFSPIKTECTVTFDSMGGSEVEEIIVPYGTVIEEPEQPTKQDSNFTGWFTDYARGNEFDFSTPVKNDMTLYAGWQNTIHEEWLFNNESTGWYQSFDFGVFDNATKYNGLWLFNGLLDQTDYYNAGDTIDEQYASFNSGSRTVMDHCIGMDIPEGKMLKRLTIEGCVADKDAPVRVVIKGARLQELATYELSDARQKQVIPMPDCVSDVILISFEMDTTEASPEARIMSISADFEDFAVPEVTGFKAYATGTDTAEIHWDKAADSRTNYYLYRSQDPKGDWGEPIAVLSNDQNEYVDNDVEVGNTYYYTVKGGITRHDVVTYGPYSNIDYARPAVPQVKDFEAFAPTYDTAKIQWTRSSDPKAVYFLYKDKTPTGDWGPAIDILDNDVTEYVDPEVATGQKTYYMVRAAVPQEDGTYLFGPYTKVDYAYPRVAEVTGFQAWAPNDQVATVAWDQAKDPNVVYFLYKGSQPTGDWGNAIKILPNGTQKYVDIDVTTGTKTYYMVRAAVKQDDGTYLFGPYTKVDYAWPR